MEIESMNLFAVKLGGQERYTQSLMVFEMALKNGDKRSLNDLGYTYELLGDIMCPLLKRASQKAVIT